MHRQRSTHHTLAGHEARPPRFRQRGTHQFFILSAGLILCLASASAMAQEVEEVEPTTVVEEGAAEVDTAATQPFTTSTNTFRGDAGFSFDYPASLSTVEFGTSRDGYVFLVSSNPGYESPIQAWADARVSARILPGSAPSNSEHHTNPNGVTYQLYEDGSKWRLICSGSNYYIHFEFRSSDEATARGVAHTIDT